MVSYIKKISNDFLPTKKQRTQMPQNIPVYFGSSALENSRIVTHKFWYDYVKIKNKNKKRQSHVTWIQTNL